MDFWSVLFRYREEGTTTSALDMMLQNHTSRYHVAAAAIRAATGAKVNPEVDVDAHAMISYVMHLAQKDKEFIYKNGTGAYPSIHPSSFQSLLDVPMLTCASVHDRSRGYFRRTEVRLILRVLYAYGGRVPLDPPPSSFQIAAPT